MHRLGGSMKYREVSIFTGTSFKVPEHIRRLDSKRTHGWQLRYGKWMMFSDHSNDGSGAKASLAAAKQELMKRIDALHAPTGLRTEIVSWKSSSLPVGISGPLKSVRAGRRTIEFNYSISIPQFEEKPTTRKVYIGTENTITDERLAAALAKAIEIRKEAVSDFQDGKTHTKRKHSRKREKA